MKLSLLQLNIQQGKYIETVISYLRNNPFDIFNLQEVTSTVFQQIIALGYKGELALLYDIESKSMHKWGNATFYKLSLLLLRTQVKQLRYPDEQFPQNEGLEEIADITKNVLHTEFEIGSKLSVLNTHLAWGPTPYDRPYKLKQGKRLVDYVKQFKEILSSQGTSMSFLILKLSKIFQSLE